jgi:hypothetical protein
VGGKPTAQGVVLESGRVLRAKAVLSNATPRVTFEKLLAAEYQPAEFREQIASIDYKSGVTKINVAINQLPNFLANPNTAAGGWEERLNRSAFASLLAHPPRRFRLPLTASSVYYSPRSKLHAAASPGVPGRRSRTRIEHVREQQTLGLICDWPPPLLLLLHD